MRQDETGQAVYYHSDALGNVGMLTDAAGAPAVTYFEALLERGRFPK
ncbi:MAG: hypothetical protein ACT4OS_03265 [Acidimicrobiales bacterium]